MNGESTELTPCREIFAQRGYAVIRNLLEPPLTAFLWSYVNTAFASFRLSLGDRLAPSTPSAYGDPTFDGLLEFLRPRVEQNCGIKLLPTFSHFRLYKRGDALKRHRDRNACEISISLNLGQMPAEPWPLFVEGKDGPFGASLSPGDALLYRGIDCFHWREPYQGSQLAQVFMHYVDTDGPHAREKFDGRAALMWVRTREPKEAHAAKP